MPFTENTIWDQVECLDDYINCNIEFIKGNVSCTPYHGGPLCEDSLLLKDNLLKLHQYKCLTVGGQGPLDKIHIFRKNKYHAYKQKAYITCFMENKYEEKLYKYLNTVKGILFGIATSSQISSTLPNEPYTVTSNKSYKYIKDESIKPYKSKTRLHFVELWENQIYCMDFSPDIEDVIRNEYMLIEICTIEYNSPICVEKIILDFLESQEKLVF